MNLGVGRAAVRRWASAARRVRRPFRGTSVRLVGEGLPGSEAGKVEGVDPLVDQSAPKDQYAPETQGLAAFGSAAG